MPPAPAARARRRPAPPAEPRAPRRPAPSAARPAPPRPDPARSTAPRRGGWRWLRWAVLLPVWGLVALAALLLVFAWDLPRPDSMPAATRRPSVTLLAANGGMLATQGDLYGETVRLRDLPAHLPAALMAVEDRRFRSHWGLDPIGLARAAWANWQAGEVVQGGSTLTQQLAKNLFLSPERNFRRKVQEALLALWLERRFTKDELLEIYLNRVYLGAGAYGVDAAARLFFGVPARRLVLWQSALLAGLPKAPSRYNPRASPDIAVARAAEVLEIMVAAGAISLAQMNAELDRIRLPPPQSRQAGWFADWALEGVAESFPGNADLTLRGTLEPRLQALVEARLEALLAGPGARAGVTQGAVVVLEAGSGAVRAMAGGRDYRASQFNRATDARRQPGSAFKPVVFLAALEHGLGPEDAVADGPLNLGGWSPGNGQWRSRGEISLEEALAHSVNTAAVRVLLRGGGARAAAAVARRLGIEGRFPNDASLALGTGEVTLLDLTAAYAAFINGGVRVTPFGIAAARAEGRAVPLPRRTAERVVAPEHAAALRRMLEAVVARGTGRAAAIPGRTVAGKTGTTQDFRDAWFIGWAGQAVIGVWLGNDDARPMDDVRGGTLPARLFREVAEAAAGGAR
ncbi:penicillin-binding protein 1A [Siccirubricoccus deserti]|uniref:PBP1A family penicillin-binding protein n=1 Tax=Siccirubricoccus deserti TaxID=2013562 RepID=A0A9X0R1N2_9PROT|nr:PBP1A family penicillin-binding protein [Siccirubricoccus deserti]MBC4018066.1 PBP1A family penicillin-binding protein [Siccirubricoccus deserti]GGC62808.1 penicillin-binding protein 1A [Siccirubricoccus deserti]